MPTRVVSAAIQGALVALGLVTVSSCGHRPPPPCMGEACREWPHVDMRFSRNREGRAYTGALCVQVSFDCPEEGRHEVWVEPEAPRCQTYLNSEGPEWLRVERGRLSIPWPARCMGDSIEMYITAQPNFATCNALNNQLVHVTREGLRGEVVFDCR